MPTLFCSRPHERFVDFGTTRFVVAKSCGLNVSAGHLEIGDEVPAGELGERALRQLYEPPLRRIETLDYAREIPDLREACARRGTLVEEVSVPAALKPEAAPEPEKIAEAEEEKPAASASNRAPRVIDVRELAGLENMTFQKMVAFCQKNGLPISGSRRQLRTRLEALLG